MNLPPYNHKRLTCGRCVGRGTWPNRKGEHGPRKERNGHELDVNKGEPVIGENSQIR